MFTYSAPTSIDEVLDILSEWGSRARILAGGQTLLPLIQNGTLRPEHLVDLNGVAGLDFIDLENKHPKNNLSVGACCRQHDLEVFLRAKRPNSLLAQALPLIADNEIRNRGTVCGSLAAALRGAELPAIALTCDANLHIRSRRGDREICATSFYRKDGTAAIAPHEILTEVHFDDEENSGAAIEEIRYTQLSFPACGAAVLVDSQDGFCSSLRLTIFGQGIPAQRIEGAESFVKGKRPSTRLLEELATSIRKEVRVDSVPGIPADYARHVAGSLGARAFKRAVAQCEALTAVQ
ncbi:MAG TPA: FAD binding domain-containing protein [Candidatus Aquilonibacter sp.]|nr:FAD binding domain-containing protein [Candidatus Aquilonibacter sp.]